MLKKCVVYLSIICLIMSYAVCGNAWAAEGDSGKNAFSNVIMNVGSDETKRNITWYSHVFTDGEVRYAKKTDMAGDVFPDVYQTAKAVAVRTVGGEYSYKASLMSLEENTDYVYCLVTGDIVSDYYTFSVNNFDDDYSFAFFTDAQLEDDEKEGSGWESRISRIASNFNNLSFMVSAGDQINNPVSETEYDYFITNELASIPVSTTVGPGHDDSVLFNEHYNLPNLSSKYGVTTTSSDYFYKYNNALVMHLNCDNGTFDKHISFIKNAISTNPDCTWRIVVLHYSFFSGGSHSSDDGVVSFREALAGNFNELNIDLVLSGHDHNYSRSYMMLDDKTMSDDVVTDNTVSDPEGTLYLCGATASGTKYYEEVETEYDAFIACKRDGTRSTVTIFDVTDTSLTMNSYFTNKTEIEKFDTFTINKSPKPFKFNTKTNMIEFASTANSTYSPLVDAYSYSSAILRVENSAWEISTDNGESYQSLGIPAETDEYILRINPETKVWEYSNDGGVSSTSTFVSSSSYMVKYINVPGSSFGDSTDLSMYGARVYTTSTPDAPAIYMHKGSVEEGQINNWSWEYYLLSGDGTPVSEFEAGNEYVAYLVNDPTPVSDVLYVSSIEDPQNYTYTWKNTWDIVEKCYADNITVKLSENTTLASSGDIATFELPVNATFDLNGYTLTSSGVDRVFRFSTGSTEAVFNIISSRENGAFNCGSKDFMYLDSSSGSSLTVNVGSDDSYPVTVKKCAYFVNSGSNFRNASKLNLNVTKTDITFTNTFLRVTNVKTSAGKNTYTVKSKYSNFNFGGSSAYFVKNNDGMYARGASSFIADNCTFKNTYDTSSKAFMNVDLWLGSMNFTNCGFDGVALDGTKFPSMSSMIIGDGCSFKNSAKTFAEGSLEFSGTNMLLDAGCELAYDDSTGIISTVKNSQTEESFFIRTVVDGVKRYYPEGTSFQSVLEACDTKSSQNIEITLGADVDFTSDTTLENATDYHLAIDLAGHTLILNNKLNLTGSGFDISIYSSKAGGKLDFANDNAYIQPKVYGSITLGSQQYKNCLSVESTKYLVSMGMIPSGTFTANYLYSDINVTGGNEGILTLNALGKANITLNANIIGCNVTIAKGVISYNPSSTMTATTNGGVFNTDSVINIKDSSLASTDGKTAETSFFVRTSKIKDRYFGKVYVEGSTISNFKFNGSGILSDNADISYTYNTYYQSLPSDYNPNKCITVGKDCVFYNYYTTFNDDITGFSSANIVIEDGCELVRDDSKGTVTVSEIPEEPVVISYITSHIDGVTTNYPSGTSIGSVLTACDKSANKDIKITLGADFTLTSDITLKNATDYNLEIDLAGHTLTMSKKITIKGSGYNIKVYSSVEGGKLFMESSSAYIQPDIGGTLILGSEQHKQYFSIETTSYIVSLGWIPSGTINVKYLYTDIESTGGNEGILTLNALGSANVALCADITGCNVVAKKGIISYNPSSTMSATTNGGVFNTDSVINIKDSSFKSTDGKTQEISFFTRTSKIKDRYYGKVYAEGSTFENMKFNGAGIYSDNNELSYTYNTYSQNLPNGYNPDECILIGKDCVFYNHYNTFNDDLSGFSASNMSLASGCVIEKTTDDKGTECIKISYSPSFSLVSHKQSGSKYEVTLSVAQKGTYTIVFADYTASVLNDIDLVTAELEQGEATVTTEKDMSLGSDDKIMLWFNNAPLCEALIITE